MSSRLKATPTGEGPIDLGGPSELTFDTHHILRRASGPDVIRSSSLSHMCRNPFKSGRELDSAVLPSDIITLETGRVPVSCLPQIQAGRAESCVIYSDQTQAL